MSQQISQASEATSGDPLPPEAIINPNPVAAHPNANPNLQLMATIPFPVAIPHMHSGGLVSDNMGGLPCGPAFAPQLSSNYNGLPQYGGVANGSYGGAQPVFAFYPQEPNEDSHHGILEAQTAQATPHQFICLPPGTILYDPALVHGGGTSGGLGTEENGEGDSKFEHNTMVNLKLNTVVNPVNQSVDVDQSVVKQRAGQLMESGEQDGKVGIDEQVQVQDAEIAFASGSIKEMPIVSDDNGTIGDGTMI